MKQTYPSHYFWALKVKQHKPKSIDVEELQELFIWNQNTTRTE